MVGAGDLARDVVLIGDFMQVRAPIAEDKRRINGNGRVIPHPAPGRVFTA